MNKKLKSILISSRRKLHTLSKGQKKRFAFFLSTFNLIIFLTLLLSVLFIKNQSFSPFTLQKAISINKNEEKAKETQFISNEILIKVKKESRNKIKDGDFKNTGINALDQIFKERKPNKFEKVAKLNKKSNIDSDIFSWYLIQFNEPVEKINGKLDKKTGKLDTTSPAKKELQKTIVRLLNDPDIETVEPNYIVTTNIVPNDPYYSSTGSWGQAYPDLWGIKKINMETAWNTSTGSSSIIVASIDTGVDRNHEDLKDNMWINIAEIPGNGVDDDNNGYVDDYYGWDFYNNDNDPMDDHGHGTHTAGTIAATGNNGIGVVGVNWKSKIMSVKFLNSGGSGYISDGAKALQYAANAGAKISSNSWGCNCQSALVNDAIKYEHDKEMVIVVAAGNSNIDALDFSPASSELAITVAASDPNDAKAYFSNWGEKIDVSAPGVDILSAKAAVNTMCDVTITVGINYCRVSGTSMATPHVTGLAALLLSKDPALTNEEIRQLIRNGATDLGSPGKDIYFGYGRIDANFTLSISSKPLAPIITNPRNKTVLSGALQITGSAAGQNFSSYKVELGTGRSPNVWTLIKESNVPIINNVLATLDTSTFADGTYTVRLTATDTSNKSYQFQVFDLIVDNLDALINFPLDFISQGTLDIVGTAQTKNGATLANYKLEWGLGTTPASWSTEGIILINNGSQSIIDNVLAQWNTTNLAIDETYTLRLTVLTTSGLNQSSSVIVKIDKDMVRNWPKYIPGRGDGYDSVVPVMTDLDNDGNKEIIIFDTTGKLRAFHKDGSELAGFPIALNSSQAPNWSPNVDDIDGDGKKEIIIPDGFNINIYKSDGNPFPNWPKMVFSGSGSPQASDRTPILTDLDGDGKKEIVVMEINNISSGKIHAYKTNGAVLNGFPKTVNFVNPPSYPYNATFSSNDIDHDGKVELAFGFNRTFYLFDNNGNLLPGWPITIPQSTINEGVAGYDMVFHNPGAFADINGDGNLEVTALAKFEACFGNCKSLVYSWDKNGTMLPGWPKQVGGINNNISRLHSPAIADINNDNKDEIALGTLGIYLLNNQASINLEVNSQYPAMSTPAIADINGDGILDFISVYYRGISVINSSGQYLWQRIFADQDHDFWMPAVIADLDNNGKKEIAISRSPNFIVDKVAGLYLWEIAPTSPNSLNQDWPMFMHDSSRTGRLLLNSSPTPILSITPALTPTTAPLPTNTPVPPTPTLTPTPSDTTPPTVTITSPRNNSKVARNKTITIKANASDASGIAKVEFYVNGTLKCTDTTASYTCAWGVPSARNVVYTLQAKAHDTKGNTAANTITVTSN
ncbi:MAG: S8 family serine peptidase [Candidatus Levybacteria bacterium]|nr:S8 family serine peptidase [Candidatus Levybacteria bacterium]